MLDAAQRQAYLPCFTAAANAADPWRFSKGFARCGPQAEAERLHMRWIFPAVPKGSHCPKECFLWDAD